MSYTPIARILPQYVDGNGLPYSGAVLKAYEAATTTPLSFSLNEAGSVLVGSIALNSLGYPAVSGNEVIPYLNTIYKLALYPNQAAADANSGAIWEVDNIRLSYFDLSDEELTGLGLGTARSSAITVGQVQDGQFTYLGTTAGSADAYTADPDVVITGYVATQQFVIKIHATNLTTTPYFQISGIDDPATNAVIKKLGADKSEIALEASDMLINGIYILQRNSANTAWILLNPEKIPSLKANILITPVRATQTIAAGVITAPGSNFLIDTEAAAATDDLATISGLSDGQFVEIGIANAARNVVVKHNTGNIYNPNGVDITLDLTTDVIFGRYDAALSKLVILSYQTAYSNFGNILAVLTASSSALLEYTLMNSQYSSYEFELISILPATDGKGLQSQVSINAGSSYVATNYRGLNGYASTAVGYTSGIMAATQIDLCGVYYSDPNFGASNGASKGICGRLQIFNPSSSTKNKIINFDVAYKAYFSADDFVLNKGAVSCNDSTTAINAMKFFFDSGAIASGQIIVRGFI